MDFNNRGRCLKGDCRSGCTVFIPKSGAAPGHPGLAECAVCADGCYAAQHEAPAQGPATGSPFRVHVKNRQEGIEAKLRSGPSAPGFDSSRKFHPAEKSQLEGDLNPNDSKNKKRKHQKKEPDSDPDRAPKRGPAAKGKTPPTEVFAVGLAENTKAVARRKYGKPTAAKLMQMNREGYVQTVHLHKNNTPEEITNAVKAAFHDVPEMEIYGFRVLEVEPRTSQTAKGKRSKKQSFWLKPIKGKLGMDTWERARALATVRDAGSGYKNTIFIALHPAAPNLRFPGLDLSVDKPDHDIETGDESDGNDASDNEDTEPGMEADDTKSKADGADQQRSGHGAQMDTDSAGDNRAENLAHESEDGDGKENPASPSLTGFSGNLNDDIDVEFMRDQDESKNSKSFESLDTSTWDPFPTAHTSLLRALKNISKPDLPHQSQWWRNAPLAHLQEFNLILPLLTDLIDSTATGELHVDVFFAKIDKYIVKRLESMTFLAVHIDIACNDDKSRASLRKEFSELFGVGPGGIGILLPGLSLLYKGLERIRGEGFDMNKESLKTEYLLHETSKALLACLTHFRLTCDRSLWDPKGGFRELALILFKHDAHLPVGDATNSMHDHLNAMDLRLDSISTLQQALEDAFGHATDPGQMNHTVVIGGEFGLGRFYAVIVEPLLDSVDRFDYDEVFRLLNDTSRALARKVGNYIKTKPGHGAKSKSSHVPDNEDASPRINFLMFYRSGHFKTPRESNDHFDYADDLYSDTAEDMTRTESAAEDWYKNIKPGPGIKTCRKRRHTTEYVPSSDTEDYAPPKPKPAPKPKPEWVDIDTPPPSPCRAQKPKLTGHQKDPDDADGLLLLGWHQLRRRIISRFPHPNIKQRNSLGKLNEMPDDMQYKRLSAVYHPDRNMTQTREWQEITAKIATAINGKRR
ncbi:hypothetical protein FB451DRAFT_1491826 [Mycena latifolia]|nr:hypothetical protein FB451DRAFT_1491826 [Mycena latifolia]